MGSYNKLVEDFLKRVNPSNSLHYYGYRRIIRKETGESEKREAKADA